VSPLKLPASEAYLEGMKTKQTGNFSASNKKGSEAYLEGMKTTYTSASNFASIWSEAYLEGMKTPCPYSSNCRCDESEAYLEGMKTCAQCIHLRMHQVRSLPRRNENGISTIPAYPSWYASEAYLEGMKTKHSFRCAKRREVSEAYLEGMKTQYTPFYRGILSF